MSTFKSLSKEDLQILLEMTAVADANWEVIIASQDTSLLSFIVQLFADDSAVKVRNIENGCDFMVACAREIPDLVILDTTILSCSAVDMLQCFRRNQCLKDVRVLCYATPDQSEILFQSGADDVITNESFDKVYLSRKMNSLLYRSSLHKKRRLKPEQERRWPRISLNVKTRIEVFDPSGPLRFDNGEARIENISCGGAYLSNIVLKHGSLPEESVLFRLRVNEKPLEDWKADSLVVRHEKDAAGVKYVSIAKEEKNKIIDLFES